MTTSFTRTRAQIAQRVLGKVIAIGNAAMASADSDTVYEAIDLRLKEMHKLGIVWRKVTEVPVSFSLSASINSASAGAGDILFPLKITFTDIGHEDPVYIIGKEEYAAIPDKTRRGNPEYALWKGGTEFLFYPVPITDGTGKLLYARIADDSSHGAAIDIDVGMIRAMIDLVKYDVADDYGVPEQKQMRWRSEAMQAERDIRKLGVQRVALVPVAVDDFETDY